MLLGIDPGLSGALAFLDPESNTVEFHDMPLVDKQINSLELSAIIGGKRPLRAIIEKVSSRRGEGVTSAFNFGMSYGVVLGVLGAFGIPTARVSAAIWKRFFSLSTDKEKSRFMALSMWPSASSSLARKKDHGRAEAGLIAAYLAQQIKANRL